MKKRCDYTGHSCECTGYKQQTTGTTLCTCGHQKSQHNTAPLMTVLDLAEILQGIPDNTPIYYEDPNYGGIWSRSHSPIPADFKLENNALLIRFPFETEVD